MICSLPFLFLLWWCPCSQRICFCTLGFPEALRTEDGRRGFLEDVCRLEELLPDPWFLRAGCRWTVQVPVPKVHVGAGRSIEQGIGENGAVVAAGAASGEEALSLQMKRAAFQKKAVEASLAAEDYARRLEAGEVAVSAFFWGCWDSCWRFMSAIYFTMRFGCFIDLLPVAALIRFECWGSLVNFFAMLFRFLP